MIRGLSDIGVESTYSHCREATPFTMFWKYARCPIFPTISPSQLIALPSRSAKPNMLNSCVCLMAFNAGRADSLPKTSPVDNIAEAVSSGLYCSSRWSFSMEAWSCAVDLITAHARSFVLLVMPDLTTMTTNTAANIATAMVKYPALFKPVIRGFFAGLCLFELARSIMSYTSHRQVSSANTS